MGGERGDELVCEGEDRAHSVLPRSGLRKVFVVCHDPMIFRVVVGWVAVPASSVVVVVVGGTWGRTGERGERMYLLYTDFDTSGNCVMRASARTK